MRRNDLILEKPVLAAEDHIGEHARRVEHFSETPIDTSIPRSTNGMLGLGTGGTHTQTPP